MLGLGNWTILWILLQGWLGIVAIAAQTQTPFQIQKPPIQDGFKLSTSLEFQPPWDFKTKPSINDTSNLIFNSVSSLLQHWANTRYRNGHTVVAGTIPAGTLFYHGTYVHEVPKTPEWVAVDPEHSFMFCRSLGTKGCWHLTLITERALKILYFDGNSAAKMTDGSMDSQDLIAWGKAIPEWVFNEEKRILDLCAWGKKYEIDGFVRMEMDFEVMLCNFTEGVKPVSFVNLSSDNTRGPPPRAPRNATDAANFDMALGDLETLPQIHYRIIEAGGWHNRFPGDIRIQLDYARLITFYDTATFPSLHPHRLNQERFFHRLHNISSDDLVTLSHRLEEILGPHREGFKPSGIQWRTLYNVITDRYAERLEMLQYSLNATSIESGTSQNAIERGYRYVRGMLMTYIIHGAVPSNTTETGTSPSNRTWAYPVFEACVKPYSYTSIFPDADTTSSTFTRSESLLASAATNVVMEICRTLVGIWAEGVELGLQSKKDPGDDGPQHMGSAIDAKDVLSRWSTAVSDLMIWLDWSHWVRCKPSCNYEETCYLPTWPYFGMPRKRPPPTDAIRGMDDTEEPPWRRPQPKCIPRVEPFGL